MWSILLSLSVGRALDSAHGSKSLLSEASMTYQASPTFPRAYSPNGNISSICSECLATIAASKDERELARLERAHICDPVRLYQLGANPSRRFQISGNRLAV